MSQLPPSLAQPPGTATIYARVPIDLKKKIDIYAEASGKSLAGAVSALLTEALMSVRDHMTLEQRVARLEAEMLVLRTPHQE